MNKKFIKLKKKKRCLECCEVYCANCFTEFHMKGALQKHRTMPINNLSDSGTFKTTEDSNKYINKFFIFIFLKRNNFSLTLKVNFNAKFTNKIKH